MPPPVWNLANAITLCRLLLSIVFFVVLYKGHGLMAWRVALGLFVVASLTDFLDGYVARKRGEETDFGRVADPLVDKILICGAIVLLCFIPEAERLGLTAGVAATVVIRELLVTWLRGYIESQGTPFGAAALGKAKLVSQTVVVLAVMLAMPHEIPEGALYWSIRVAVWIMMGLTVLSGIQYFWKGWRYIRGEFRHQ